MNNFKTCSTNFLEKWKTDIDYLAELYSNNDIEEIKKIFNNETHIKELDLSFNYNPLLLIKDTSDMDHNKRMLENIKIIKESFGDLPKNLATSEEFWFTMINVYYLDYYLDWLSRYKDIASLTSKIKTTVFLSDRETKNDLLTNRLSMLWWTAYYWIDINSDDVFWILDMFLNNKISIKKTTRCINKFQISNSSNVNLGVADAFKRINRTIPITYEMIEQSYKYLNIIGGYIIVDVLSRDDINALIFNYIKKNS